MKKVLIVLSFLFGLVSLTFAGNIQNQLVSFDVQPINEISVSGNPGALSISTATAGSNLADVSDATTTYNITTNGTKRITGAIDSNMPANTSLKIQLAAPSTGTGQGAVTLSTTAGNLVTAISPVAQSNLSITYTLSASVAAGAVSGTRTVTITLTD